MDPSNAFRRPQFFAEDSAEFCGTAGRVGFFAAPLPSRALSVPAFTTVACPLKYCVSGSSEGGNSDGINIRQLGGKDGSGTRAGLKVATFVRLETPRCRSSNAQQTGFAETKCRVLTCSPRKPKRRGHWACTGCGSMAVGGHGDVQGCVHLGRRKASRFWAMLNHYFGRCHLAEIESLICNRCPSRLRHIRYTCRCRNKP